jgi:hypothetical protein
MNLIVFSADLDQSWLAPRVCFALNGFADSVAYRFAKAKFEGSRIDFDIY